MNEINKKIQDKDILSSKFNCNDNTIGINFFTLLLESISVLRAWITFVSLVV